MRVEPNGSVSNVEIVAANPPGAFNSEVVRALTNWKFEPPGRQATHQVEFEFKSD
jgi:periplasmic protein TonB